MFLLFLQALGGIFVLIADSMGTSYPSHEFVSSSAQARSKKDLLFHEHHPEYVYGIITQNLFRNLKIEALARKFHHLSEIL
jgi:ABC-type long-subunit fatty acid transport system fused permease/ATPase subunit